MARFLLERLLQAVIVVLGVTLIAFVIMHLSGDPVELMLPIGASVEQVEEVRAALGLDRPLPVQYVRWLGGVARLDFGRSLTFRTPNLPLVLERVPVTATLAGLAVLVGLGIGMTQRRRMMRIGGGAFQSVQCQFLNPDNVFTEDGRPLLDAIFFAQPDQFVDVRGRIPDGRRMQRFGIYIPLTAGVAVQGNTAIKRTGRLFDDACKPVRIEIDVGYGCEQGIDDELIKFRIDGAQLTGLMRGTRNVLDGNHDQILQGGRFRILAAGAERRATFLFGGLFALITEHNGLSLLDG